MSAAKDDPAEANGEKTKGLVKAVTRYALTFAIIVLLQLGVEKLIFGQIGLSRRIWSARCRRSILSNSESCGANPSASTASRSPTRPNTRPAWNAPAPSTMSASAKPRRND
jgi:hypothetical protein